MNEAKTKLTASEGRVAASNGFTQDAFHQNAFQVLQPAARGNRSGMDALLLAASLPDGLSGTLADLGAGAGVAGFACASRNPNLHVVAVERNTEMARLARASIDLDANAQIKDRVCVLEADVSLSGVERHKAGLENNSVDYVIMNPPYNSKHIRAPEEPMRAEAFMMAEGGLDAWFRTAAAILRQRGILSMIYRTERLGEIIACAQGRFGNLEIIPIHSRQGDQAKRMIVRGTRGSRGPLTILPGFVVHGEVEKFTPAAKAIFDGKDGLGY